MALFNKISDIARNIGDKASETIEITKLNSKISTEEKAIAEYLRQIGEVFYRKHQAGEPDDPAAAELFALVNERNKTIADAQAEIAALKQEPAAPPNAAPAASDAAGVVCPSCNTVNPPGTRFCGECGGKLEAPPQPPEENLCKECGTAIAVGAKFCANCGAAQR